MNENKRKNFIDWDTYFMGLAQICALRSKDPNTQVGAVLKGKDNIVIGLGYNGMPLGLDNLFPWKREGNDNETKYKYVIHAEVNAVFQTSSNSLEGSTLYVTLYPCSNCAKILAKAGIEEIVFLENKYKDTDDSRIAKEILTKLNIKQRQIKKTNLKISVVKN